MRSLEPTLRLLADDHAGVLTRRDLRAAGWTDEAIRWRSQGWVRVLPGTYAVDARPGTHPGDLPLLTRAWAGLLHAGPGSWVAGQAAARLHGLVDHEPDVVEIAVPEGRRLRPRPGWAFTRHRADVHRPPRPGALPLARVEDVALDLAAVAPAQGGRCLGPVLAACQRRLTTAGHLRDRLRARHRHPHRRLLLGVLDDIDDGATTYLEVLWVRRVLHAHGLPLGRRQARTGTRALTDQLWDDHRLVAELDGRAGHDGAGAFRDMDRDNAHTVLALSTLRYGYAQVAGDPCSVAAQVAATLRAHGWTGSARTCPRCPAAAGTA